jgi:hypothetical protein
MRRTAAQAARNAAVMANGLRQRTHNVLLSAFSAPH